MNLIVENLNEKVLNETPVLILRLVCADEIFAKMKVRMVLKKFEKH